MDLFDTIFKYNMKEIEEMEPLIKEELARVIKETSEVGTVITYCDYVTFNESYTRERRPRRRSGYRQCTPAPGGL